MRIVKSFMKDNECPGESKPLAQRVRGGGSMGLIAATSVNRESFGMVWNMPLESGGWLVGKYAQLTINAEADLEE
jgi:polyisoprenoid-binding protein YceI